MFLGGCPCCGKKECWRCYGKSVAPRCPQAGTACKATIKSITPDDYFIEGLGNAGLEVGQVLPGTFSDNGSDCYFGFFYEAPDGTGVRCASLIGYPIINLQVRPSSDLSVTRFEGGFCCLGIRPEHVPDAPESACAKTFDGKNGSYIDGEFDGKSGVVVLPLWTFDVFSQISIRKVGDITLQIDVYGESEVPPPDDYQCFDAPPDEDGWTPVGKCHKTEEECAKSCGPTTCYSRRQGSDCRCFENNSNLIFSELKVSFEDCIATELNSNGYTGFEATFQDYLNSIVLLHDPSRIPSSEPYWNIECDLLPTGESPSSTTCDGRFGITSNFNLVLGCESRGPVFALYGLEIPLTRVYPANLDISLGQSDQFGFPDESDVTLTICELNNGYREIIVIKGLPSCMPEGEFAVDQRVSGLLFTIRSTNPFLGYSAQYEAECTIRITGNVSYADAGASVDELFYDCLPTSQTVDGGWTKIEDYATAYTCESECGSTPTRSRTMSTTTTGPGTQLAKTLASWGFKEGKGCSCKKMSRLMDGWGSACAKDPHLTTIIDHLAKEAAKRKLPFVRKLAEALIKRAVRQSENQS